MPKTSSVLLFGGRSEEKLVSVASAQNLSARFPFDELLYMTPEGAVHPVTREELAKHDRPFELQFKPTAPAIGASLESVLRVLEGRIVFLGFHGTEGEDGTMQEMFEKRKIAYTGSSARASRECFDKLRSKEIVGKNGIATAPELRLRKDSSLEGELQKFFAAHRKIVIKPVASGSSFGLHIVDSPAGLAVATKAVMESQYDLFMAEKFIVGRELTVGVLANGERGEALPPSEVRVETGRSFDYAGKYLGKGTIEVTPADLTPMQTKQAQEMAVKAHQALGCYGYTRTDMILTDKGLVYLETNTLPGLSRASFVPQQLEAASIPVPEFIEKQLALARSRYD